MTFGAPQWFWALALIPLLLALFLRNEGHRARLVRRLVAARLAGRLAGSVSVAKRRLRFGLMMLGLACVITALAQPRLGYTWEQSKRKGRDVLLAIDTSRSMLADDLAPNRLTRAKLAAQDLIGQLGGDRVGLIAFAGSAFLQAPLTVDFGAVLNSLRELDTEIIPRGGTNIADAIRTAVEAFGKGESEHRALILFSDGEEIDADGVKAAEKLEGKVRIFTVGLGSPAGSLIPVPGKGSEFVKDQAGQIVKSRLDEQRLRKIAEVTGGFYVRSQAGRADVERILRDGLGKMSEHDIDTRASRQPIERYQWPLAAGVLLLAASMLIGERRAAKRGAGIPPTLPRQGASRSSRRTAVLTALLLSASVAFAKNSGVEAYERKDYQGALNEFTEQLKRQPDSPVLHFDLGGAAYKTGDYDTALQAFGKALTSTDPELRAKAEYNLANTLVQRGVAQKEKAPKIEEWKNALQHYEQALKLEPRNADAQHNREVVRKMIEEAEKEPPKNEEQQQKQDQQQEKQDKEKQDQQQQSPQQEQPKEGEQQKDQQPQPRQDGEGKEQQQEQMRGENEQQKDSPSEKGDQAKDAPGQPDAAQEQPAKKPEGELKSAPQYEEESKQSEAEAATAEALAAAEGKMTEQQAKNLVESLKGEDRRVQLLEPGERKAAGRVLRDW